ncbi:hypothetical protein AIQ34_27315 [Salmonella enterica]|nr:hypothetical protein [Salmonella enterica]EAS1924359.1 hypothetical protein [Salmonella enterica]
MMEIITQFFGFIIFAIPAFGSVLVIQYVVASRIFPAFNNYSLRKRTLIMVVVLFISIQIAMLLHK